MQVYLPASVARTAAISREPSSRICSLPDGTRTVVSKNDIRPRWIVEKKRWQRTLEAEEKINKYRWKSMWCWAWVLRQLCSWMSHPFRHGLSDSPAATPWPVRMLLLGYDGIFSLENNQNWSSIITWPTTTTISTTPTKTNKKSDG